MFWIGDDVPVGGGEYSESAALLVFRCMESSGSAWESLQGQDNEAQEERRSFQQKYNAFQEFCKRRDSIHEKYQQRLAVMRKLLRLRQLRCEKALRCDADEVAKALAGGVDVEELEQSVDESEAAVQRLMDCSGELFNFILISDVDPEKLVELGTLQQTPSTEHDEYLRKFFATWQYPRSGDQQDSNEDGDEGSDTVTRRAFDEPEDAHWWQQWERYNKANTDGLSFVEVRRQWERYARPRVSQDPLPGVLPPGMVTPALPSSPLWRACLVRSTSNETPTSGGESHGHTNNWVRMVLPDC